MTAIFAGVMSGTSLDGADAAIVSFAAELPRTLAFASLPFPPQLRARLLALSAPEGDGLDEAAQASLELADLYSEVTDLARTNAGLSREQITAVGCHGQTVRHRPEHAYTIQLNDPARMAERIGIDVVADFRRRDMAAGGQGAPLVPAFHDAVFRSDSLARAIVNLGGISNVSLLVPGSPCLGFDCGPGNVLLDAWAERHLGAPFDADGAWAARGRSQAKLLERFLEDDYFRRSPPKSTGRERFNAAWLDQRVPHDVAPEDVQATLVELTARVVVDAIERHAPATREIFLCGGGARNRVLASKIGALAGVRRVADTDALGISSGAVEATAFAWLAMKCVRREPVDYSLVTGARGPRILGAIYPR